MPTSPSAAVRRSPADMDVRIAASRQGAAQLREPGREVVGAAVIAHGGRRPRVVNDCTFGAHRSSESLSGAEGEVVGRVGRQAGNGTIQTPETPRS